MWNYISGVVMLILFFCLYIVLPIWVIRKLYLWIKKRGDTHPKRKYKVISIPIILLNAIPGFIAFLDLETDITINEDIWGILMVGTGVITIVHAIVQCRLAGLWIGPVRYLLGLMVGISAGAAIVIVLGVVFVAGFSGTIEEQDRIAKENTRTIYRNGHAYQVQRIGDSEYFSDPETRDTLREVDGRCLVNRNGDTYEMWD